MADTAWLGTAKPIIAMVHFPPLPGSPGYDPAGGMAAITDSAARDIEALQDGGIDAVMFGNEGDRPYELQASPEALAAMAAAIATLKPLLKVPFGVNYLWDPVATVALGALTTDTVGFTRLAIDLGPFGGAEDFGPLLWPWAIVYLGLVGTLALKAFARRDL